MTAEVDVNGGGEVSVPPKDLPNGNANADAGLVFVNGNGNGNIERDGEVSGGSVQTDLKPESGEVEVIEAELDDVKVGVERQESVCGDAEKNGLKEKHESSVVVDDEVDRENGELGSSNGVDEHPNSVIDNGIAAVESAGDDDQVQHSDLADGDQCTSSETDPSQNLVNAEGESSPAPVPASEALELIQEIPQSEEVKIELKESDPHSSVALESEVSPDKTGIVSDTGHILDVELVNHSETAAETFPVTPIENGTLEHSSDAKELVDTSETAMGTSPAIDSDSAPTNETAEHTLEEAELVNSTEIAAENSLVNDCDSAPVGNGTAESTLETEELVNSSAAETSSVVDSDLAHIGNETVEHTLETEELVNPSEIAVDSAPIGNETAERTLETADTSDTAESFQIDGSSPAVVETACQSDSAASVEPEAGSENSNVEAKGEAEMGSSSYIVENDPAGDAESADHLNNDAIVSDSNFSEQEIKIETNVSKDVTDCEKGPAGDDNVSTGLHEDVTLQSAMAEDVSITEKDLKREHIPEAVVENGHLNQDLRSEAVSESQASSETIVSAEDTNVPEGDLLKMDVETKVPADDTSVQEGDLSKINVVTKVQVEDTNVPGELSETEAVSEEKETEVPVDGTNLAETEEVSEEKVSTLSSKVEIVEEVSEEKVSTLSSKVETVADSSTDSSTTDQAEDTKIEVKVPEVIVGSFNCQSISFGNASEEHNVDDRVIKENNRSLAFEGEVSSEPIAVQVQEATDGETQPIVEATDGETHPIVEATDGETHPIMEGTDGIRESEVLTSTLDCSVTSPEAQNTVTEAVPDSEAQDVGTEVVKRPFYCLIKVPRFEDDNLKEQIKSFQLKVDEKTSSRDAIRDTIQLWRATFKESGEKLEAILSEEKAAREALKSKRQEIDSLQSVIFKVKNAISMEDIDGRIRQMRHMIEHETLPLKEEKKLIREIEQLKQQREQFSSSMGKQDEIQQAFDQKDQIEERLKVLRKEADSLRENVSKAEAVTQAARRKHKDLSEKLRELQSQFKAADDTRQEAYKSLQSLRKQAYDKNKFFWKYKDDVKAANDLLAKGDKTALQNLCDSQVESVLEMWNNNDEFRREYVKCNTNSTIRRLKTLDGRSLGPNEEPPVIRPIVINRMTRDIPPSQVLTVKEEKSAEIVPMKAEKENRLVENVGIEKVQAVKTKKPAKPIVLENGSATISGRKETEEEAKEEEEPRRSKEDEELARKAEELRKREEAARLLEQHRLEEKVKAKEALERKKRIAEKAQARAALRAQKEAEEKEREREKRARKKEKKRVGAVEDTSIRNEEECAASMAETTTETPTIAEPKDKMTTTATKKSQKALHFTKQTKSKSSVPLPLRYRGKRRMQSWMWVVIAALVVFALFLLGNSDFSFKSGMQWFGF